jgi:hypothetical protein
MIGKTFSEHLNSQVTCFPPFLFAVIPENCNNLPVCIFNILQEAPSLELRLVHARTAINQYRTRIRKGEVESLRCAEIELFAHPYCDAVEIQLLCDIQ